MNAVTKIIGAVAALLLIHFIHRKLGAPAAVIALAVLLLGWLFLHLYAQRRFDAIYSQFQALNAEQKAAALRELDAEIREDIEERIAKEKSG